MPDSSTARRLLEFSRLLAAGEHESALALIDALIAEDPDEGRMHWQRARTLERLERWEEARAAVKRVLELRGEFAPAWVLRAELGEESEDYDPEPDLRHAIALDPKLGRARYVLGLLLSAGDDTEDEARAQMDAAIELDPMLHEAFAARAGWSRIQAWTDQPAPAEEGPGILKTSTGMRFRREHLERALADFDRAIAIKALPNYRFARADLLHTLGRHGEALAESDRLLAEITPEHSLYPLVVEARARSASQGGAASESTATAASSEPPSQEVAPQYVPASAAEFPAHQRAFAAKAAKQLAGLGFDKLGDYEPAQLAAAQAPRQMISLHVRSDGRAIATAFSIKPASQGVMAWLAMNLKGVYKIANVVEIESAFTDGTVISTSNARGLATASHGPHFLEEKMPTATTAATLLERHEARVTERLKAHPGIAIRPVRTFEDVVRRQAGQHDRMAPKVRAKLDLLAEQGDGETVAG